MNAQDVRSAIKERFARVALTPLERQPFPIGPDSARRLGYDPAEIASLPAAVTESFAGVGNPFTLGEVRPGEIVLDLGCGAGMDAILAARRVAPAGRVLGVDLTEEMVAKAARNAQAAGVENAEFLQADGENLPVQAESVDVVITNGVFNLCLDKPAVLAEIFRVLRPGGRLQMADILLEEGVTQEDVARKGAWSD